MRYRQRRRSQAGKSPDRPGDAVIGRCDDVAEIHATVLTCVRYFTVGADNPSQGYCRARHNPINDKVGLCRHVEGLLKSFLRKSQFCRTLVRAGRELPRTFAAFRARCEEDRSSGAISTAIQCESCRSAPALTSWTGGSMRIFPRAVNDDFHGCHTAFSVPER